MSKDWNKINEARAGYIAKRNRENEQITTLTEEQHKVIQWLCSIRHEVLSSWEGMFNIESADYDKWDMLNDVNGKLINVELPKIEFGINFDMMLSTSDWDLLFDDERDDYEQRAEDEDRDMSAFQLWYEEAYASFCEDMEKINTAIEKYLADIDKQHGTNYCPSGSQRIY